MTYTLFRNTRTAPSRGGQAVNGLRVKNPNRPPISPVSSLHDLGRLLRIPAIPRCMTENFLAIGGGWGRLPHEGLHRNKTGRMHRKTMFEMLRIVGRYTIYIRAK